MVASLERAARSLPSPDALLSPDERDRAARFGIAERRRRFVLGRAVLRAILAERAGSAPAALAFTYGVHGKPALARAGAAADLRFNVTHSGDALLVATATGLDVGVDVERVRELDDVQALARRALPAEHAAAIEAAAPHERAELFFVRWTRLEALLKARGLPLAHALGGASDLEGGWSARTIRPRAGYVGAVAVEGTAEWTLVIREWPD